MNTKGRLLVGLVSPYMALGTTDEELNQMADKLTGQLPVDPNGVAAALALLSTSDRQAVVQKMLARGASAGDVASVSAMADQKAAADAKVMQAGSAPAAVPGWALALHTAGMAAGAYHGYKRNKSVGWAIVWGALGAMFPIIVPVIALAQGFGKPKGAS